MRKQSLTLTLLAVAALAGTASANLLQDGSFDLADNAGIASNSAWTLTVNMPDGSDPAARFNTGFANSENDASMPYDPGSQQPGTGRGVWFRPFEGAQGGSSEPLAQASIAQDVIAPHSTDYLLTFRAAIEGTIDVASFDVTLSSSGTGGSTSIDLLTAGIVSGNMGGDASPNRGGTPFALKLTGVTAGDTISVVGAMVDGKDRLANPQSGFLDRFELTAVPEPGSIVLAAMGGLGALLAVRRRR